MENRTCSNCGGVYEVVNNGSQNVNGDGYEGWYQTKYPECPTCGAVESLAVDGFWL
jgi:ribosomal protein S27AE